MRAGRYEAVDIGKFIKSKWYRKAEEPGSDEYVRENFADKVRKVGGKVADIARQLYDYFRDPSVSTGKKILIIAGAPSLCAEWVTSTGWAGFGSIVTLRS